MWRCQKRTFPSPSEATTNGRFGANATPFPYAPARLRSSGSRAPLRSITRTTASVPVAATWVPSDDTATSVTHPPVCQFRSSVPSVFHSRTTPARSPVYSSVRSGDTARAWSDLSVARLPGTNRVRTGLRGLAKFHRRSPFAPSLVHSSVSDVNAIDHTFTSPSWSRFTSGSSSSGNACAWLTFVSGWSSPVFQKVTVESDPPAAIVPPSGLTATHQYTGPSWVPLSTRPVADGAGL